MIYWCNTAKVRLVEFTALNFMLRKLAQADFKDSKLSMSQICSVTDTSIRYSSSLFH